MNAIDETLRVLGSKGGGKGKGSGSDDAQNTLRSKARARWVELISEGECEGLVDGAKSIYFEQTPVQNADGTYNFKNVLWQQHRGLPDEGFFRNNPQVETPENVEIQVKEATGPVLRTIVEQNADSVRVIMRIPALFRSDEENGSLQKASVSYAIDVRPIGGQWTTAHTEEINDQKTTSVFQKAHRIELPEGGHPWDIRVRRITPDSTDAKLQNETWWEGYVVVVEGKFIYPHSGAVAMEVNAEDMGQSIPARSYRWRGIKCLVPSNYNPVTGVYSGIWNGTFKRAWTRCPPWIFYDILTNDRYGLGEFIDAAKVDKWSLYMIGQYCDQLIPSGYKNPQDQDIMEPRFSFNGTINNREEAYAVLQQITTAWRGMGYWSRGQVFASADMPADPVKLVSRANIIGEFEYSGTAMKARHSVAVVTWNDPADFYRPTPEVVINEEMLRRFGWREKPVQLRGVTSRGLAHRHGKWILDTEQNETETVSYVAAWDHADIVPGNIIAVSDPHKAAVRAGGRIVSVTGTTIVLDATFQNTPGESYSLMATMPSGQVVTRPILGFSTTTTTNDTVLIGSAFPSAPQVASMWAITGTDIVPRLYRVLSLEEVEKHQFRITALFHDPNKYARVEQNIIFDPLPYHRPRNVATPPSNLTVREVSYSQNGRLRSKITLSWRQPPDFSARAYRVWMSTPSEGYVNLGTTQNTSIDISDIDDGEYVFNVATITFGGLTSSAATINYTAAGPSGIPMPTVSNLRLFDRPGQSTFVGRDCHVTWNNNFAKTSTAGATGNTPSSDVSPFYRENTVKIYDNATNTLLRTQRTTTNRFNYTYDINKADALAKGFTDPRRALRFEVTVTDTLGRTSASISAVFSNPAPPAVVPSYIVNGNTIFFDFPTVVDEDFVGIMAWRSTATGFDPSIIAPFYDVKTSFLVIPGEDNTTYFFRFAAYDAFGKNELNISNEIEISTMASSVDTEPPAIPTGLAVVSSLATLPDGTQQVRLRATCDANTEPDLAGYVFEIEEAGGNFIGFTFSTPEAEWVAKAGVTYRVHVLAYDRMGNKSGFSTIVTHVAAKDTVPPAVPTGLTASAGIDTIWLKWTINAEPDFAYAEIYENTVDNSASATLIGRAAGGSTARTGLALATTRHYWLKSVDTSGNKSAFTAGVSATTGTIPNPLAVAVSGITFTPNVSPNRLSWTGGEISYGSGGGAPVTKTISAGFYDWVSGTVYIYYVPGNTAFSGTTVLATMYASSGVLLGIYKGGTDFQLVEGKAKIDGAMILAQTIGANQLVTNQAVITGSAQIANAIVGNAHITELSAAKIEAGTALASSVTVSGRALSNLAASDIAVDDMTASNWVASPGLAGNTGTWGYLTNPNSTASGSRFLRANADGMVWLHSIDKIPFDPSKLYKLTFRIRRPGALGNTSSIYLGVRAWAADGVSGVSLAGVVDADIAANCNIGPAIAPSSMNNAWVEFSGFLKGTSSPGISATGSSVQQAAKLHPSAKFISAFAVFNFNSVIGGTVIDFDSVKVEVVNEDAAQIVNAGSTQIEPGKIVISGGTTLADWRQGGDITKIAGGAISANTIDATRLTVGLRGITMESIEFEHNKPAVNQVSWTAGVLKYIGNDGNIISVNIAAGSATRTSGILYLTYTPGASTFSSTTVVATAFQSDRVILATYAGGTDLVTDYGRTVIDGAKIKTGTVDAAQLKANIIQGTHIVAGSVEAVHIATNAINTNHMVVTDWNNYVEDPLFSKGSNAWPLPTGVWISNASAAAWQGNFSYNMNAAFNVYHQRWVDITVNTQLQLNVVARGISTPTGTLFIRLVYFDENNASVGVSPSIAFTSADAAYTRKTLDHVVPVAAVKCRIQLYSNNVDPAPGSFRVGFVGLYKRFAGDLIVDGSIDTNHLKANSIAVGNIQNNAITTAKVATDAITATQVAANAITGVAIANGAVVAAKIATNAVTSDKIAANSVTSGKIDVGKLDAISADVGVLTAGVLRSADSKFVIDLTNGYIEVKY